MVEDILEVDAGTVTFSDSLEDIDWDSLCNITFVAEVDTKTGATLDADKLAKAQTVGDLFNLLTEAVGAA